MSGMVEALGRIADIQTSMRVLTEPQGPRAMGTGLSGGSRSAGSGASTGTLFSAGATTASPRTALDTTALGALGGTDFAAQLAALTGAAPTGATAPPTAAPGAATGADLVAEARQYIGVPYVWGGSTPQGLDCSGLVQRSLSALGVDMPRVARDQMREGAPVASLADAVPGDLVVFNNGTHIGIYVGDGRMIDAPKPGDVVRERAVYETPTAIRRVLPLPSEVAPAGGSGAGGTAPTTLGAQVEQLLASNAAQRSTLEALLGAAA